MNLESNNNTLNARNPEKFLITNIDSLTLVQRNTLENVEDKLINIERLRKEKIEKEKEINKNKWFWENREQIRNLELERFEKLEIPAEITKRINQRKLENESDLGGLDWKAKTAILLTCENEELKNWIKADLIVNEQTNNSLMGIKKGIEKMNKEIDDLRIENKEKEDLLKKGESQLNNLNQKFNSLNETKSIEIMHLYDERIKEASKSTNDVNIKLIIAESEACKLQVQLDKEIDKYEREKGSWDLKSQKEKNEKNELSRWKKNAEDKLKEFEEALETACKQIIELEKERDDYYQLYKAKVDELIKANDELQSHTTINAKTNRFINNYTPFEQIRDNLIKIFLFLTLIIGILIGYFLSKLFTKKSELKINVGKDQSTQT